MEDYQDGNRRKEAIPWIALGLDFAAVGFAFLGTALMSLGGFGVMLGMICYLLTVASPVGGIVTGISYLCREKGEKLSKIGVVISISAIMLPIAFVVVMAVLFGTGVAVIALM